MKAEKQVFKNDSKLRSLIKSFTWRIIAIADTILIVLLITCLSGTCNIEDALSIGFLEFFFKLVVYFVHERIWIKIQVENRFDRKGTVHKTISWRILATLITLIVAGAIIDDSYKTALYITGFEVFTKTLLYYLHERLWLTLPLGRIRRLYKKIRYGK